MHELLDTLQGRSIVENAEERGYVEPAELEALALELDLGDQEMADFTQELESLGLEIGAPVDDDARGRQRHELASSLNPKCASKGLPSMSPKFPKLSLPRSS